MILILKTCTDYTASTYKLYTMHFIPILHVRLNEGQECIYYHGGGGDQEKRKDGKESIGWKRQQDEGEIKLVLKLLEIFKKFEAFLQTTQFLLFCLQEFQSENTGKDYSD